MAKLAELKDSILSHQELSNARVSKGKQEKHVLIYFIPGNPSMIEYYRAFFAYLSTALDSARTHVGYSIIGNSLAGFEIQNDTLAANTAGSQHTPLRLRDQIEHVDAALDRTVRDVQRSESILGSTEAEPQPGPMPVILVGHSVGKSFSC